MSSTSLDHPAKIELTSITLDGEDVIGLFVKIELFENIFLGGVTGSIVINDNDGAGFIEKHQIEFNEEIKFSFTNLMGHKLEFEGYMNGLRDEMTKNQLKTYVIDFTSKAVRQNEMVSINKAFRDVKPEDIISEMVSDKLESELIQGKTQSSGEPMTWVSGNRKPIDVIRYVLNHAVSGQSQYQGGEKPNEEGKSSGTSGYLCWETLDGYRMTTIDQLLEEDNFSKTHENYVNRIANSPSNREEKSKTIMMYDFPKAGDYFGLLRSGAVKSNFVSFDMDTGIFTTFKHEATTKEVTQKVLDSTKDFTRTVVKTFANEKFNQDCNKGQKDTGDQARKYLPQTITRQNTFSDTQGRLTLPAQYNIRAGDMIDIQIYKNQYQDTSPEPQKKHSGKYLISQVGHHIMRNGHSYTKLSLIRANTQQDASTSQ